MWQCRLLWHLNLFSCFIHVLLFLPLFFYFPFYFIFLLLFPSIFLSLILSFSFSSISLSSSYFLQAKLTLPLNGRSAILGDHQNNSFIAVKCGRGHLSNLTYVLTKSGLLCQFNKSRELDKFTDIKCGRGYCLECSEEYVMCGCGDGVIRLFDPASLDYIATMPRPHPLNIELSSSLHSL